MFLCKNGILLLAHSSVVDAVGILLMPLEDYTPVTSY